MKFFLRVLHLSILLTPVSLFISCAGYQLGNVPYQELKTVETVYVPVIQNESFEPSIQVMTTNAILRKMDQDGTFSHGRIDEADATLEVTITEITRVALQRARRSQLVSEQYQVIMSAEATLLNHQTGQKFMDRMKFEGTTDYFVTQNRLQEGERQQIVLASQDLADNIVRYMSEGW
ncbi:MAG: LPS assembly lipoprotein LptE [Verrucomicrobiota bacterium]